jgi:hypothetical protein
MSNDCPWPPETRITNSQADMNADKLIAFRQIAYECLGRAHEAIAEIHAKRSPFENSYLLQE